MKKLTRILALFFALVMLVGSLPMTIAADEGYVAEMTIFSYTKFGSAGHSWLYFKNISNKTIIVGLYKLEPGKSVSVGTHKLRRSDGAGVYYNIEQYITEKKGASGRISTTKKITASQLETVSKKINSNNKWTLAKNCAWFAVLVWNSVPGTKLTAGGSPAYLKGNIKKKTKKSYQKNKAMSSVKASECFKQKGNSIVVVSSGSLKKGF